MNNIPVTKVKTLFQSYSVPLSILALLILWEITALVFSSWLLVRPSAVALFFVYNFKGLSLDAGFTVLAALGGIILAVLALLTGVFLKKQFLPEKIITVSPPGIAYPAIMIIVLTPVLVVWLGPGIFTGLLASALVCFFPVAACLSEGYNSISRGHIEMMQTTGAPPAMIFFSAQLPPMLSHIFSTLKTIIPCSLAAVILTELLAAGDRGLGAFMAASLRTDTVKLLTGVLAVILLNVLLNKLIDLGKQRLMP